MNPSIKKALGYGLSVLIGCLLLYLSLRGISFSALLASLKQANFTWLPVLGLVILASHILRAWRWTLLMETLPSEATGRIRLSDAFWSVMVGYMVNAVTPRLGEIARCVVMARQVQIHTAGVIGTVVVERLVDTIVLALGLVSTALIFQDQVLFLLEKASIDRATLNLFLWSTLFLVFVGSILVWLFYQRWYRKSDQKKGVFLYITQFLQGLQSVWKSPKRISLLLSTLLMWGCYLLMAYLPAMMMDLTTTNNIGLDDAWGIMLYGSLGIAIPSPGGIGSYHYITRLVLDNFYAVQPAIAMSYAVITHGINFLFYIFLGVIGLFKFGVSWSGLRQVPPEPPPDDRA